MDKKLTKKDFNLLEKVFENEIDPQMLRLPFQTKSKIKTKEYERLEKQGMVEFVSIVLPGRFPVTVKGWVLTHLGRMEYCANCPELPDDFEQE